MHKYFQTTATLMILTFLAGSTASNAGTLLRERDILTSKFGMPPSSSSNADFKVELDAGRLRRLKFNGMIFNAVHHSHGKNLDSYALRSEDDAGGSCTWMVICAAASYDDAANWFCTMLSRQSSMPFEMRVADMEKIEGVGDFCISDSVVNRKFAFFIRGTLAVYVRIEGNRGGEAVSLASSVDSFLQRFANAKRNTGFSPIAPKVSGKNAAPRNPTSNHLRGMDDPDAKTKRPLK